MGRISIAVVDGQGGGVGRALVQALKAELPGSLVTALGTNAAATAAMLKAGADQGATGENAIRVGCGRADVILGVVGILRANALLGEITPAMALAISESPAEKVLLPMERCGVRIVGVRRQSLDASVKEAAAQARQIAEETEKEEQA